ncbi:MAG: uracil-DNA glycosylase [bacterium]|nr:uracil-DNA glycosylase [bacterium]
MDREEARRLLNWYVEIGVDEATSAVAIDRFVVPPAAPLVRAAPARGSQAPTPTAATPEDARSLAAGASSLAELIAVINAFDGCPLKRTATTTCVADGNARASIMIIGEAPGAEEDRQGKPFVGPAGKLLDRMLAAIGLDRTRVYITNTLYWRPPGNRTPTPAEIAVCLPFLERQVELLAPRLLVYAGGTAVRAMFDTAPGEGITRLRGRWLRLEREGREPVPAIAMFHPAYLLRQPLKKRESWRDLLAIRERMDELGIAPGMPTV